MKYLIQNGHPYVECEPTLGHIILYEGPAPMILRAEKTAAEQHVDMLADPPLIMVDRGVE